MDAVFGDLGQRAHDGVHGARENVHAAHDEHVVGAAEDSAFEHEARACASAHEVAGAVAEQGTRFAAERREDEFAGRAVSDGFAGFRIDDFREVGFLDDVQRAGFVFLVKRACASVPNAPGGRVPPAVIARFFSPLECDRADFRHAVVVEHLRAVPCGRDAFAHGGHAAAGLARDENFPHRGIAQRQSFTHGDLGEMQRVGRRAEQHFRAVLHDAADARGARKPAAGDAEAAVFRGALESRPEPEERPERKREIHAVTRRDAALAVDARPVAEHPVPALRSVEDGERLRGRPARLAEARVAFFWKSEVRSEWRMRRVVRDEVGLRGERDARGEILDARDVADAREARRLEAVTRDCAEQLAELRERAHRCSPSISASPVAQCPAWPRALRGQARRV